MPRAQTKIMATIGPACDSIRSLQGLYDAGMRIARLNASHGSHEYFTTIIARIRRVSATIAILLDTKGPEVRTRNMKEGMELVQGQDILISSRREKDALAVDYKFINTVGPDTIILIDDGAMEVRVIRQVTHGVLARVLRGGVVTSRRKVSIKKHNIRLPFLSSTDKADIAFARKMNVDFIAASFVRSKHDVLSLRKLLDGSKIQIISKIEHPDAVKEFDDILQVSDGVMVARGDLGVECSLESIPGIQARILSHCNDEGKPVIVATQMLESMIYNSSPTRAEVSDVATAVLQGADAVMLSGETSIGKYPIHSVAMMRRIIEEYGPSIEGSSEVHNPLLDAQNSISTSITYSATLMTRTLEISAIIAPTVSGYSARMMARHQPKSPILAFTKSMTVLRQLQLSWGVLPFIEKHLSGDLSTLEKSIITRCVTQGLVKEEDTIVVVAGHHKLGIEYTNLVEVLPVHQILNNKRRK